MCVFDYNLIGLKGLQLNTCLTHAIMCNPSSQNHAKRLNIRLLLHHKFTRLTALQQFKMFYLNINNIVNL